MKGIWFSNDQGFLTIPRVLFSCILFALFPVNLSADRGQSSKCETFHPQVSSNFVYVNIRMALSGSSSGRVLQKLFEFLRECRLIKPDHYSEKTEIPRVLADF